MARRPALKRFRDWVVYWACRLLLPVGRIIPVRLGRALGGLFGRLGYALDSRDRRIAIDNVRKAFPDWDDKQVIRTVRDSFRHMGVMLFEVLRIPRLKAAAVGRQIEFEGIEHVRAAMEAGRGIVIASGHIGNWELMGAAASQIGVPLNVIARRLDRQRLNDLVISLRSSAGVRTILRDSSESAKQILGALRRGEMLALLIDQDIDAEGAFVEFFGRPAWTATGAAALALRTGALFAAAASQRLSAGRHIVRVQPIEIDANMERDRAIIDATQRATSTLEQWIRERPEQWPWLHRRWRTQPTGDSKAGDA